jgi:ABC-type polysaccharide/polyol phosphate export permease
MIVYIIELYFIILGISLIISALYVKFRDLSHIWDVLLQIGFWITPIIYPLTMVPEVYHRFIYLNPLARLIEYSRAVFILGHIPAPILNLVIFLMTVVIMLCGILFFRHQEASIPENI